MSALASPPNPAIERTCLGKPDQASHVKRWASECTFSVSITTICGLAASSWMSLRDFYCSVIGLTEGPRPNFASFGYWLYARDKPILHLTEAGPDEMRKGGITTTFDHVAFRCED